MIKFNHHNSRVINAESEDAMCVCPLSPSTSRVPGRAPHSGQPQEEDNGKNCTGSFPRKGPHLLTSWYKLKVLEMTSANSNGSQG